VSNVETEMKEGEHEDEGKTRQEKRRERTQTVFWNKTR
jgi:hypothetical protein